MAALYCALARVYFTRHRYSESLNAARRAAILSREVGAADLLADAEMARAPRFCLMTLRTKG